MTPDEFQQLASKRSSVELLKPCLRDDVTPYVFVPEPNKWDIFRDVFVSRLQVSRENITVVGSARFGFSLKPGNNLRSFSDTSDIDVIIVDSSMFDRLWLALLDVAYPRPPVTQHLGGWLAARRNEVYTGWLTPLEVRLDAKIYGSKAKPVLEFNTHWFNTFKEASRHPPRRHKDVNGRLYRTWEHAELYHLDSLATLRKSLTI